MQGSLGNSEEIPCNSPRIPTQKAERRGQRCGVLVAMFDATTISYHYCVSDSRVTESIGIEAVESNGGTEARN